MEEHADIVINDFKEFIDLESKLIKKEHHFHTQLQSVDLIIGHLDERISEDAKHLHELNGQITDKLVEINKLVESDAMKDLSIVNEEKSVLKKLELDVDHKDWKAVKKDVSAELEDEKSSVNLGVFELHNLYVHFTELKNLIKKKTLIHAIKNDDLSHKEKKEYEHLEEHYFMQIYKFVSLYQHVFKHLLKKETHLWNKARKDSKK